MLVKAVNVNCVIISPLVRVLGRMVARAVRGTGRCVIDDVEGRVAELSSSALGNCGHSTNRSNIPIKEQEHFGASLGFQVVQ